MKKSAPKAKVQKATSEAEPHFLVERIATIASNRMPVSDPEEEAEDIFAECEWCNAPIYHGNASVEITRHIQQVDSDEITVINAEALLTLCASCGNRLDEEKLGKALKSLLAAPAAECETN